MRLIQVSDAHLSSLADHSFWSLKGKRRLGYLSWYRNRRHQLLRSMLDTLTDALAREEPDMIAVTGDLVHIGLEDELEQAREWLAHLNTIARLVVVPGNHDCYQRDAAANVEMLWNEWFQSHSGVPRFPFSIESDELCLIGLSSAEARPFWSAGGRIGDAQLARLEGMLERSDTHAVGVLIHHPPYWHGVPPRKALDDADRLQALLRRKQVDFVLHGHLHVTRREMLGRDLRVLGVAAASSVSPRHPAAYRIVDTERTDDVVRLSTIVKQVFPDGRTRVDSEESWSKSSV